MGRLHLLLDIAVAIWDTSSVGIQGKPPASSSDGQSPLRLDADTSRIARGSLFLLWRMLPKSSTLAARFWAILTADEKKELLEAFLRQVSIGPDGECWKLKYKGKSRYGNFWVPFRIRPHRFSWMAHTGIDIGDLHVLHRCDTPRCINPSHLFLGTHADNIADARAKGRMPAANPHPRPKGGPAHFLPGEANPAHKLTVEKVQEILSLYERGARGGMTQKRLAEIFVVSQPAIRRIVNGTGWLSVLR